MHICRRWGALACHAERGDRGPGAGPAAHRRRIGSTQVAAAAQPRCHLAASFAPAPLPRLPDPVQPPDSTWSRKLRLVAMKTDVCT